MTRAGSLAELRRLAENARGNGKWRDENTKTNAQMDYMAAVFDPAAILALLDALDESRLVGIIEQAIFETETGLTAALLASERIAALAASPDPEGPNDVT